MLTTDLQEMPIVKVADLIWSCLAHGERRGSWALGEHIDCAGHRSCDAVLYQWLSGSEAMGGEKGGEVNTGPCKEFGSSLADRVWRVLPCRHGVLRAGEVAASAEEALQSLWSDVATLLLHILKLCP